MATFSTRQAAKLLGIDATTLSRYIAAKKVPSPKSVTSGGTTLHIWTEADIERVRKLLPKIKNGRKTRYKKEEKSEKPPKRQQKS
jgi:predicted DNA-binding transcriptional regulator AlpA